MKLIRLTLDHYGAFRQRSVGFGPALTVVHGPNEAGKSTLTHAIGDVLWGLVPRQHRYAFEVAPSRLQLTADLEDATGRHTLTVSSRGHRDPTGAVVSPWWTDGAVTSRPAWESGYGLDRDRLRRGGQAVLRDGGDLADLLFEARTGVDLGAARHRMVQEAETIWRRHRGARTVLLRAAKQTVDDLGERLADAVQAADTVAGLAEQLRQAEADLHDARAAHARAAAAADAARRDSRAHRAALALAALAGDIAVLGAEGTVLSDTDLARHDELTGELTAAQRTRRDLEADLAALDATALPDPDPDALAVADRVDELRRGEAADTERRQRCQRLHGRIRSLLDELRQTAADLHPALALADDATVRAGAPALVVPADLADLLDRLADVVDDARRGLDDTDRQVRAAVAELGEVEPASAHAAHRRWDGARRQRDQAWQRVRDPWLAGELPDLGVRATLAADLDVALSATDVAAGDAAAEAEQQVERQTRADERQRRLDQARHRHDQAAARHAELVEQWRQTLQGGRLPPALDVPAWRLRRRVAHILAGQLAELAKLHADADELTGATDGFQQQVAVAVAGLDLDPTDPAAALAAAHRRVSDARHADSTRRERQRQRATLRAKQAKAEAAAQQATAALAQLTAPAPGGDVAALVERSRRLVDLHRRHQTVLDQLRAAAPGDDPDELVARLAGRSVEQVAQAVGQAEDAAAEAVGQLEQAQERRTALAGRLRAAQQDRDAAGLRQQQVDALDRMAALARRWARLQLMAGLLERVVEADGPQADTTLLQHAGAVAATLTGGRVQGLTAAGSPDSSRRLVVELSGDVDADTDGLSEGTADQVFLALRLAGIRQRQQAARADGAETLPVVLDDVLMAHDDRRTEAALALLAEEARHQQIIVFTHHRAVAATARTVGATVVELGPLPDPARGQPAPGR